MHFPCWLGSFISQCVFILLLASPKAYAMQLVLAKSASLNIDPSAYLVSEKLDGVRAFWDGKQLRFRSGNLITTPAWFTQNFPKQALDGELWIARNQFERLSATVRRFPPLDEEWRKVRYMVFELPDAAGDFNARVKDIRALVAKVQVPWLQAIEQREITSNAELIHWLRALTAAGGEGLMLHRKDAPYQTGRSDALLKLKFTEDAEATVIGYLPGKGKYQNMVGSLQVQTDEGVQFRIGSGLKDADRKSPPPIGSRVTYRFRGLTRHGKPRFPTYWRVRIEL